MRDLESMSSDMQFSGTPAPPMRQVQYGGRAAIPLEWLMRDYVDHLTPRKLLLKALRGSLADAGQAGATCASTNNGF
jgi:hypothetical protein